MAKQPIVSFKDEEEFLSVAKDWKDKLFLGDWLIKFTLRKEKNLGETEDGAEKLGLCAYDILNKQAVISVANGEGTIAEFTLVHELLHCLTEYGSCDNLDEEMDAIEAFYRRSIHSRLNQMAKSLLLAKYPNIDKEFFSIELEAFVRSMEEESEEAEVE